MKTLLSALIVLVAFTCARAASAADGARYTDARSGISAALPDGFTGTHERSPDAQLLMQSKELDATINVFAKVYTKREVSKILDAFAIGTPAGAGEVVHSIYEFKDHLVGFAPLPNGRMIVLSARPEGLAIGNFVGSAISDQHAAVVDFVARSISNRAVTNIRFDVPRTFKRERGEDTLFFHDDSDGSYIILADDETDAAKPFEQQAVDVMNAGLVGRGDVELDAGSVRVIQKGLMIVSFTMITRQARAPMAGVLVRAALPGRPMWIAVVSPGTNPESQRNKDNMNFVLGSLLEKTMAVPPAQVAQR